MAEEGKEMQEGQEDFENQENLSIFAENNGNEVNEEPVVETDHLLGVNTITIPRIRLTCGNCYWHRVRWKGRTCEDYGYGEDHDGCKNWVSKRPTPENRAAFDIRISLSKMTVSELNAIRKFVTEAIENKKLELDIKIGDEVKYTMKDEVYIGVCVNLSQDKHGEYIHLLTDEGTLIQACSTSVTKTDGSEDGQR